MPATITEQMPNVNANDSISYLFNILLARKANPQVRNMPVNITNAFIYVSWSSRSIVKMFPATMTAKQVFERS